MLGLRPNERTLSVFLDPAQIPQPIRPKDVVNSDGQPGLNGETTLYKLDADKLRDFQLRLGKMGRRTHVGIEAVNACTLDELNKRIAATLPEWSKA